MAASKADDVGNPWLNLLLFMAILYIVPYIPWWRLWTTNTLVPGFHKKTVIVTSLQGTLGLGLVRRLSELGVKVIVGYSTREEAVLVNEMRAQYRAQMLPLILLRGKDFKDMVDFIDEGTEEGVLCGGVWGVVDNSNIPGLRPLPPMPADSPYSPFPLLVMGVSNMLTHFVPALRKTSGRLVTVGRGEGSVTEDAFLTVIKSLRTREENRGIRVSTVRIEPFLGSTFRQSDFNATIDCVLNALFAVSSYEDYVIKAGFVRQIKNTIRGFFRFER